MGRALLGSVTDRPPPVIGGPGSIMFVNDYLTSTALNATLTYMHAHGMYKNLVFYLEACESGSMFADVLSPALGVFATTAADPVSSSYAIYFDKLRRTCVVFALRYFGRLVWLPTLVRVRVCINRAVGTSATCIASCGCKTPTPQTWPTKRCWNSMISPRWHDAIGAVMRYRRARRLHVCCLAERDQHQHRVPVRRSRARAPAGRRLSGRPAAQ